MLCLKRPSLTLPLLTLIFLLLLAGVAEALVRLPAFQSRLMAPALNTPHRQFETQWWRLQKLAKEDGNIDCIFLGNSMVVSGFDPLVFAHAYQEETGNTLQCFNLGIDAIPAMTAGFLATILMEEYQPSLLIYGIDARDLAVTRTDLATTVILDTPWLQYRLGRGNIEGWLVEHSALYRSRRLLSNLSRFHTRDTLRSYYGPETALARLGYDPVETVADYITVPPDPSLPIHQIQRYYELLSEYEIQPENIAGLEMLLGQQQSSGQMLVVEMPVPDTYFYFFSDKVSSYEAFTNLVDETTARYNTPFWRTTKLHIIPNDGWMDYGHLNANGARFFSEWLGKQVAYAVENGELSHKDQAP
jgi:hypothetical protein